MVRGCPGMEDKTPATYIMYTIHQKVRCFDISVFDTSRYSSCGPSIVPVARHSACEIAWHKWEETPLPHQRITIQDKAYTSGNLVWLTCGSSVMRRGISKNAQNTTTNPNPDSTLTHTNLVRKKSGVFFF